MRRLITIGLLSAALLIIAGCAPAAIGSVENPLPQWFAGKTLEGEVTTVTQIIGTQPSAAEDPTAPAEPEAVTITTTEKEINIGGDDLKAGMAAEGLSYTEKAEGNSYIINAFSSTETGFSSTIISFCNIPDSGKVIFSHIVREKATDTSTTTITKGILTVASQG